MRDDNAHHRDKTINADYADIRPVTQLTRNAKQIAISADGLNHIGEFG